MNTFKSVIGKVWGTDGSRGFKLAAWGIAAGVLGAWTYYDSKYKGNQILDSKEVEKMREKNNLTILEREKLRNES